MINKNKETIEKIEKGCGAWSQGVVKGLSVQMQCGNTGFKDKLALCEICRAELKATIKTSIEWCEDEIEFLNSKENGLLKFILWHNQRSLLPYDWFDYEHPRILKRLEQLTTHLKWLKEQEKN